MFDLFNFEFINQGVFVLVASFESLRLKLNLDMFLILRNSGLITSLI